MEDFKNAVAESLMEQTLEYSTTEQAFYRAYMFHKSTHEYWWAIEELHEDWDELLKEHCICSSAT